MVVDAETGSTEVTGSTTDTLVVSITGYVDGRLEATTVESVVASALLTSTKLAPGTIDVLALPAGVDVLATPITTASGEVDG